MPYFLEQSHKPVCLWWSTCFHVSACQRVCRNLPDPDEEPENIFWGRGGDWNICKAILLRPPLKMWVTISHLCINAAFKDCVYVMQPKYSTALFFFSCWKCINKSMFLPIGNTIDKSSAQKAGNSDTYSCTHVGRTLLTYSLRTRLADGVIVGRGLSHATESTLLMATKGVLIRSKKKMVPGFVFWGTCLTDKIIQMLHLTARELRMKIIIPLRRALHPWQRCSL